MRRLRCPPTNIPSDHGQQHRVVRFIKKNRIAKFSTIFWCLWNWRTMGLCLCVCGCKCQIIKLLLLLNGDGVWLNVCAHAHHVEIWRRRRRRRLRRRTTEMGRNFERSACVISSLLEWQFWHICIVWTNVRDGDRARHTCVFVCSSHVYLKLALFYHLLNITLLLSLLLLAHRTRVLTLLFLRFFIFYFRSEPHFHRPLSIRRILPLNFTIEKWCERWRRKNWKHFTGRNSAKQTVQENRIELPNREKNCAARRRRKR